MTFAIKWDQTGKRFFEAGVDHGVLYVEDETGKYPKGVAWNGLTAVNEAPSGAEPEAKWADNIKYLNLMSNEEFAATIEAFTYPDEFDVCNGIVEPIPGMKVGQQPRKQFGFSYRTLIGNDIDGIDHGYKLHLVYGALAGPSDKNFTTLNDQPDAISLSWEVTTTPIPVPNIKKPTARLTFDSRTLDPEKMKALEEVLYGKAATAEDGTATEPRLPLPEEVITILGGVVEAQG